MREPYPIPGIVRSYRHTRELPTVVMPLLIAAVFAGLVVFYVKSGDPPPVAAVASSGPEAALPGEEEAAAVAVADAAEESGEAPAAGLAEEPRTEPAERAGGGRPADVIEIVAQDLGPGAVAPGSAEPAPPGPGHGAATREALESRFTTWMSTTALDTYIRARNAGYEESFWQRGHWIPAVEGRWHRGALEFRIVIDGMPSPEAWQWRYRINQTETEFARTAFELQEQGFRLQHYQVFVDGAATRRVQAVWWRPTPAAEMVER